MKTKILIIILLLFLSKPDLNAQGYSCNLAGKEITFLLNTRKINVKFKENYTALQRNSIINDNRIDTLPTNLIFQSANTIFNIKPNIKQKELEEIISKINKYSEIEFASPFLAYESGVDLAISNEIIVKVKGPSDTFLLREAVRDRGVSLIKTLAGADSSVEAKPYFRNIYVLKVSKENILNIFEIVKELQKDTLFLYAEPNFIRQLNFNIIPNDPEYPKQWALPKMSLPNAWNITTGTSTIKIAILDSGVDLTHPDLQNNILSGHDATWGILSSFQQTSLNTFGGYGNNDAHGTSCAGIVAAVGNNNTGVAGVAYNCKIIPIRIARTFGISSFYTDDIIIADGIGWAWQSGADILSNSWGGGPPSSTISNAISDANTNGRNGKGCPVLFSSGNKNNPVKFPATYSKAIAVGATNKTDHRCTPADWGNGQGSCYGLELDIAAPGVDISSTDLQGTAGYNTTAGTAGNYTDNFGGTSAACPFAAGVMALILSANPDLNKDQARFAIESTCDKIGGYLYYNAGAYQPNGTWCNDLGYGRINAQAAVAYAQSLIPPPAGSPINVTLTAPSLMCWGAGSFPKLTIKITGGNPHILTGSGAKYYLCQFYDNVSHTVNSNSSMTSAYFSAFENSPKSIDIDFPGGLPTFPFTKTYYLDVWGSDYVHHYNAAIITVTINRNPTVTLAADLFVCAGVNANIGFGATVNGGTSPYTYQWSPVGANLTNPVAVNCTATNMQSTETYTLTAVDNVGCSGFDKITVNVSQVAANAGPDKNLCINVPGQTIGLQASGGFVPYTYSWSPGAGLSNSAIYNPIVTVTTPGTYLYALSVTDAVGCTSTDNVAYSIGNIFPTANAGVDVTVCPGGTVTLIGTASGNNGATMTWTNGTAVLPGLSTGNQASASVNPSQTTTYTFTVVDPNGCSATDQVIVTCDPALGPTVYAGPDITYCSGASASLNALVSGGTPAYAYSWKSGTVPISTSNPVTVNPSITKTYEIYIKDANGCVSQDQVIVHVNKLPSFSSTPGYIKYICLGSSTQLGVVMVNASTPPYTFLWTPSAGLSDPTIPNPIATPPVGTLYGFLVTDANGCSSQSWGTTAFCVAIAPPIPNFNIIQNCSPLVELSNTSVNNWSRPPGYVYIMTYLWSFDGNPGTSIYDEKNMLFNPISTGYHDVTLTATSKEYVSSTSMPVCYTASITKSVYVVPTVAQASVATACGTYSGTVIANDKIAVTVYNSCPTVISNGARATYVAGSGGVTLNPGFEAVPGSAFWAFIEEGPCMPPN